MQIEYNEANEATYCPEDDKIRLYVGRVPGKGPGGGQSTRS